MWLEEEEREICDTAEGKGEVCGLVQEFHSNSVCLISGYTFFFPSKIAKNSLILIANNDTQKKKKKKFSMELNFKEIEFQLEFFKTGKATSSQSSVAKFSHN